MAIMIKCKMCGGDLVLTEGSTLATCEYCGSTQTVPAADSEKKLIQFERAERLRRSCDFDKAAGVYESIVAEFRQEAEAYWGLVLCKYGIEYVDDPASGKKVPTCHRSSFDSILDDSNYEQTLENADAASRKVYREEAKAIEDLRKGIIEVSGKEDPYDVFICYKETAEDGQRTIDSVLAQDLYDALTEKGYRVFFSRITLEDKLGQEYEPYIFAALNSAKVMLAVGTDYEYFNAVWVKNEWSRFLKLMEADKSKHLIPCYKGIDAYDMPKEFNKLQAQDLGKVGAVQDLLRGVDKLIGVKKAEAVSAGGSSNIVAETLEKAYGFLNAQDWTNAGFTLDTARGYEPDNVKMLIGRLMLECKVPREELLASHDARLDASANYQQALRVADSDTKNRLEKYNKTVIYNLAVSKGKKNTVPAVAAAIKDLEEIAGFKDAGEQAAQLRDILKTLQGKKKKTTLIAVAAVALVILVVAFAILKKNYLDPLSIYNEAVALMEAEDYIGAEEKFKELDDFQDNNAKVRECRYLYGQKLMESGQYLEAVDVFTEISEYSDSKTMVKACYYSQAEQLMAENDLQGAQEYFRKAGDYQDAIQREQEAYNEERYQTAQKAMAQGTADAYKKAAGILNNIRDYKDGEDLYCQCRMEEAIASYQEADYEVAIEIFKEMIEAGHAESIQKVNTYCQDLYTTAEARVKEKKNATALSMFEYLARVDFSDSAERVKQITKQIADEEAAIEGIWYSTDAWFAGGLIYAKDGKWAWNSGRSASDMDNYVSGKYAGSSFSYNPDTQTFTLRVTTHANGEKEYLTAQIINGKLVVKSTDPDEAFYPGTYRKIEELD